MNSKITIPIIDSINNINKKNIIFITCQNIFELYKNKFKNTNTIVLQDGETNKNQATVNEIISQLIKLGADKTTTLIGVGGGVITDITGFAASVYMRGIKFGFIPTTLLAMVDASIGGKNGVNFGLYKNFIGTINQPQFIVYDFAFLKTLPQVEWQNGFAEIIKHACIKDETMFTQLQNHSIQYYQKHTTELAELIQKNAAIKIKIAKKDVLEKGERRLLNFGHTLAHAIENVQEIAHGKAVAIGMNFACKLSSQTNGFKQTKQVCDLLQQYELPTIAEFDKKKIFSVLKMDKKKEQQKINFIVLEKIGKAKIELINLATIQKYLLENIDVKP